MTTLTTLFMTKKLQAEFKNMDLKERIKDLEAQLAEANEVIKFYGAECHWKPFEDKSESEIYHDTIRGYGGSTPGHRARQYLQKYMGGK